MTTLKPKNCAINIIRKKKEIYYSLFAVVFSFLIYFLIAALIDVADSQPIFPFFLLIFGILLIRYNLDAYFASREELNFKFILILFILFGLSLTFILCAIFGLVLFLFINFAYIITIIINFLASILMYYILRKEIQKYYLKKNMELYNEN
ncbi:MAG TPA: hypothetical protein VMV43_00525 [Candidatus Nanopelagicaceae bacterium]|nr:hypothetical protein [Candidatus Nanopelagicaceae bacterium]